MTRLLTTLGWVVGTALVAALPIAAEETGSDWREGWHFEVTPYVWMASLKGDLATLPPAPTVDVDVDFSDILSHTDLALMLALDVRRDRFGFLGDLVYLSISADEHTPGPLFGGVRLENTTLFATMGPYYRVIEEDLGSLDVFAGARVWYVDTTLKLRAGLAMARRSQADETWADGVAGARGAIELYGPLSLAAFADVGGGGSDLTWEAGGTLDYTPWKWLAVRAGYRHVGVDYDHSGFVFDVDLSGPIIGASIRF